MSSRRDKKRGHGEGKSSKEPPSLFSIKDKAISVFIPSSLPSRESIVEMFQRAGGKVASKMKEDINVLAEEAMTWAVTSPSHTLISVDWVTSTIRENNLQNMENFILDVENGLVIPKRSPHQTSEDEKFALENPSCLAFRVLSYEDTVKLSNHISKKDWGKASLFVGTTLVASVINKADFRTSLVSSALVEAYIGNMLPFVTQGFSPVKLSTVFSIFNIVLDFSTLEQNGEFPALPAVFERFRHHLMSHSNGPGQHSCDLFSIEEAKLIATELSNSLFSHLSLFQTVLTTPRTHTTFGVKTFIETAPFPEPLHTAKTLVEWNNAKDLAKQKLIEEEEDRVREKQRLIEEQKKRDAEEAEAQRLEEMARAIATVPKEHLESLTQQIVSLQLADFRSQMSQRLSAHEKILEVKIQEAEEVNKRRPKKP